MPHQNNKTSSNIHLVEHSLAAHKLTLLRDKGTSYSAFRQLIHELSLILSIKATEQLPTKRVTIETPLEKMESEVLAGKAPVIIPILRAGLGMVEAFLKLFPLAHVGHIGLMRDENTHQSQFYYFKIPYDTQERPVFLCDPMLATGGSAVAAVSKLKSEGVESITMINIIAAPEGIERFHQAHPDVPVFVAAIDKRLNEDAYIVPGLGDAGDRSFGTTP